MPLLSDLFGLIRVIHLPDRTDRLREITEELEAIGLHFSPGDVELYLATRPTEMGGFRSLGSRGCFLSHLSVLRDARDRDLESILVLEDDCDIPPAHRQHLYEVAREAQQRPWGFLYPGHIVPLAEAGSPHLIEFAGPLQNTHCYAVHRSVIPSVVAYLESCLTRPAGDPIGGPMDVDGALTMFRSFHPEIITLIAQPSLVSQRSSRSDITERRLESVPGIRQAMGLARSLRRKIKTAL